MTASTAVTVRAPAKVNLQLAVGPAREDGFHDLVNVFHAVSIFDEVTVIAEDFGADRPPGAPVSPASPGSAASMVSSVTVADAGGSPVAGVPLGGANLAVRAADLLARAAGAAAGRPAVRISVRKAIPVAGGMAGGSADAAAALVACDSVWRTGLPRAELLRLAAELGSDVPFALVGATAVGTGRGERLRPLPDAGRRHWVFALANGGLSTADVYREYDRLRPDAPTPVLDEILLTALRSADAPALGRALSNDLQSVALSLRPALRRTLEAGREAGALGGLVSGSGPTCAFLAADAAHAERVAASLDGSGTCLRTVQAHGCVPGATVL